MSNFDDKLLKIEEEMLKLFKQNTYDSEMQFLMSLPFLKTNTLFSPVGSTSKYYAMFDERNHSSIFTETEPIIPVIE